MHDKSVPKRSLDEGLVASESLEGLACQDLPRYEADDGPLTDAQFLQVRARVP